MSENIELPESLEPTRKEGRKYPIAGYAPGDYICKCSNCKKMFMGDKRAWHCEPCAEKLIESAQSPSPQLNAGEVGGKVLRWVKASNIDVDIITRRVLAKRSDNETIMGRGWFQRSDKTFFWCESGFVPMRVQDHDKLLILDDWSHETDASAAAPTQFGIDMAKGPSGTAYQPEAVPVQQGEVPVELIPWIGKSFDTAISELKTGPAYNLWKNGAISMYHRDQEQIKALQEKLSLYEKREIRVLRAMEGESLPDDVETWLRIAEDQYSHQKSDQDAYRAGAIDLFWNWVYKIENPTRQSFVKFAYGCMHDRDKARGEIKALQQERDTFQKGFDAAKEAIKAACEERDFARNEAAREIAQVTALTDQLGVVQGERDELSAALYKLKDNGLDYEEVDVLLKKYPKQ